ncbi:MAG: endonuclease/exonuclease/phosphatase family protein [Polyangiaceae bacterium]
MNQSFNEIAGAIDKLYPPTSLRDLAKRFRYLPGPDGVPIDQGQIPSGSVSLRALATRVGPSSLRLESLHYNTYLMRTSITLADFIKLFGGWGRFFEAMNLVPAAILAGVLERLGSPEVCGKIFPKWSIFGLPTNPLYLGCVEIGEIGRLAAFLLDETGMVVDAIFDFVETPLQIIVDVVGQKLSSVLHLEKSVQEKPDIDARTTEIGDEVSSYDIVSLCEVWQKEHRDKLLEHAWPGDQPPLDNFNDFASPSPGDWEHLGSGLLVFSRTRPFVDKDFYIFNKDVVCEPGAIRETGVIRNSPKGFDLGGLVDTDLWSRKGIKLTLVDVGFGYLELYSTHLYSGGAGIDFLGSLLPEPTDDEKARVRKYQIQALVSFIQRTHDEKNVAIVVGDFNVETGERANLQSCLKTVGPSVSFDDWYDLKPFRPLSLDTGHTNRGEHTETFNTHCTPYKPAPGSIVLPQNAAPNSKNGAADYYCMDDEPPHPDGPKMDEITGERIDYVFVQRPEATHAYNLDVSRIRRRAFKRADDHSGTEIFMSDHLGLEMTLFVNPKT